MTIDMTTEVRDRLVRAYALWIASQKSHPPHVVLEVAAEYERYINGTEPSKAVKVVAESDSGRLV